MAGHVSARDLAALGIATALFIRCFADGRNPDGRHPNGGPVKGSQKDDRISKVVADACNEPGICSTLILRSICWNR